MTIIDGKPNSHQAICGKRDSVVRRNTYVQELIYS